MEIDLTSFYDLTRHDAATVSTVIAALKTFGSAAPNRIASHLDLKPKQVNSILAFLCFNGAPIHYRKGVYTLCNSVETIEKAIAEKQASIKTIASQIETFTHYKEVLIQ